jgi:hypothetical protein
MEPMNQNKNLDTHFTKILLTALALFLALSSFSYSAEIFCGVSLGQQIHHFTISLPNGPAKVSVVKSREIPERGFHAYDMYIEGEFNLIGHIIYTVTDKDHIHISDIDVNKKYRKMGLASILFQVMISETGTHAIFSSILEGTNSDVFRDEYNKLSDPNYPTFRPDLKMSERKLIALKETPAYKIRKAVGLGKIVKYTIKNCKNNGCDTPDIQIWVTKPDP